eukprot:TRINITY_DN17227_c0_g1_i1.p1 TRINITY_DN17227_c0_g1~~TRINITY_DN17227_c0_g1_i1.p1  ORF type:complete len:301 (-),score=41.93 TRINITY_DN17227_c0_g1_i1:24-926(-)
MCMLSLLQSTSAVLPVYFTCLQYRKLDSSLKGLWANKFVRFTLIGAIAVLSNSIFYFGYYFSHFRLTTVIVTTETESICLFLGTCSIFAAISAHISLLYMRTKGLFTAAKNALLIFMAIIMGIFFCSGLTGIICEAMLLSPTTTPFSGQLNTVFTVCSTVYSFSIALLDTTTTICFGSFVRQTTSEGSISPNQQYLQTRNISMQIIAKSGVGVSLCALITVLIFISERLVTGGDVLKESLYLVCIIGMMTVPSLWITMKIRLDNAAADPQEQEYRGRTLLLSKNRPMLIDLQKSTDPSSE